MKTKSIKYNAIMNSILNICNILFPLISFPYVSRILSVENMGKVNFYTNIGGYAIMIAGLGISTYGVRACAQRRDDKNELSKCVHELFIIKSISTTVVLSVLVTISFFIKTLSQDIGLLSVQLFQVSLGIVGLEWFFSGIEKYSYITKRAVIFRLLSLVLLFTLVKDSDDYLWYALITVFPFTASTICNLIYSQKFISYKKQNKYDIKQHIEPSLTLFGAILAVSIYTSLDTIMLGFISGNEQVGYYTVAVKIKTILLVMINSISTVLLPRLSFYVKEGKDNEYRSILKKSINIILLIALPLTLYFIIEAKPAVLFLSGDQYLSSVSGMRILMPILLISGFSNIVGNQILLPHGMDKHFLIAVSIGAGIDFLLNILLMPSLGYIGAAIATLVAEIAQATIQTLYAQKYLKGNVDYASIIKISISSLVAVLSIIIFNYFVELSPFFHLAVSCVVFAVIYWLGLCFSNVRDYMIIQRQLMAKIWRR